MPKIDMHPGAENIVQLPNVRRPPAPTPLRATRPLASTIVPFEAWITVRDQVAAALLGGTRCLVITGPAGTGKTVMLEDVGRLLRAAGRSVVVRQADAEPASPGRGETLFVDEADRLPSAKLRQLMDRSEGTVVLAGLGTLAQRAGPNTMHLTLAPLGQEGMRQYVAHWLTVTGRTPAHLDGAGFRQLAEASGGVPRLLATLLGAGAWLAESGGAGMITAAHIQEAAELRSVLSPVSTEVTATAPDDPAAPAMTATTTETVRRGWVMWSALVVGLGAGAILAPRLLPAETGWVTGQANRLVTRAEQWLGGVSGRAGVTAEVPAERVVSARVLPPIVPHVVPASEPAEVARGSAIAGGVAPEPESVQAPPLSVRTEPVLVPTLPSPTADPALLPVETRDFLVRRGHEMAAMDDISAARLLFRRAAEGGSAEAMYELGRTYDPAVRTGLGASQADKAEAMNWYRRAAAQGVSAAQAALSDN